MAILAASPPYDSPPSKDGSTSVAPTSDSADQPVQTPLVTDPCSTAHLCKPQPGPTPTRTTTCHDPTSHASTSNGAGQPTGGFSTLGALAAGALAHLPADCCATTPATVSTHSGHSQASDVSYDEADLTPNGGDLTLEEFRISTGCGIVMTNGDWPQRICHLRAICSSAEAFAVNSDHEEMLDGRRGVCVRQSFA